MITWRRVTGNDFPLLRHWLAQPHVARWWNHDTPGARNPSEDLVVLLDAARGPGPAVPVRRLTPHTLGVVYVGVRSGGTSWPPVTEVADETMTLDYLIGDAEQVGRGHGPRMIRALVRATWRDHPYAPAVLIPVPLANRASWRALEKAGLCRVAEGELEPDSPAAGRAHYVYRATRPTRPRAADAARPGSG
uniref:Putative aminoglycoside 6'-N-acetyltransferase type II n=1 Tax=Streptomyces paromomycinus TaxID=92743 RepID=Q2MF43_STREY|nr:putative aminoglycoside 6'-N-acetyltransferase type II [Streptomyces paromomycinus]